MRNRHRLALLICVVGLFIVGQQAMLLRSQEHEMSDMSEDLRRLVNDVRLATVDFHDIDLALEAGYGKFLDCFTHDAMGGMGQHYVNGDLVADDILDPLRPEALVYQPTEDGKAILVAFEYLVFADAWDPDDEGREPPVLFDREFSLKTNIPDTPPVWALHIWLGTHNPEGLFADYNPTVFCPEGLPVTNMS